MKVKVSGSFAAGGYDQFVGRMGDFACIREWDGLNP